MDKTLSGEPPRKKRAIEKEADKQLPTSENIYKSLNIKKRLQTLEQLYDNPVKIGSGTYGSVYKVLKDGKELAVKEIKINRIFGAKQQVDNIQKEIDILRTLKCQREEISCFIIEVYNTYVLVNDKQLPTSFLIEMPLIKGGSADNFFTSYKPSEHSTNKYLDYQRELSILFYECVSTLQTIHDNCILHLDIKPANLLYQNTDSNLFIHQDLKYRSNKHFIYTDFGSSCFLNMKSSIVKDEKFLCITEYKGSPSYIDPHVILGLHYNKPIPFNEYSDVYSLGMTFYNLLTNKLEDDFQEISNPYNKYLSNYKNDEAHNEILESYYQMIEKIITNLKQIIDDNSISADSTINIMLTAIIQMISLERSERPSLKSVIHSFWEKDANLLKHEESTECLLIKE